MIAVVLDWGEGAASVFVLTLLRIELWIVFWIFCSEFVFLKFLLWMVALNFLLWIFCSEFLSEFSLNLFLNFCFCASEFSSEFFLNFSEFFLWRKKHHKTKFRKIQKKIRRKFRSANNKIQKQIQTTIWKRKTKIQTKIPVQLGGTLRKFRKNSKENSGWISKFFRKIPTAFPQCSVSFLQMWCGIGFSMGIGCGTQRVERNFQLAWWNRSPSISQHRGAPAQNSVFFCQTFQFYWKRCFQMRMQLAIPVFVPSKCCIICWLKFLQTVGPKEKKYSELSFWVLFYVTKLSRHDSK